MVDGIDVPLDLADFDVTACEVVDGVLQVSVRSTRTPACHHCGSLAVVGHGRNERCIRDRACVRPTVLRWAQRRLRCKDCGQTSRERHPELAGRRSITRRFHRHLFEQAVGRPFVHVAAAESVSCYRVLEAFESHSTTELIACSSDPPRVIAVDESSFRKRLRFCTIVSDPERRVVLDVIQGRSQSAALEVFLRMDPQVRAGVETVVMDYFWNYRVAAERAFPGARIVADRFHIQRSIMRAARAVRAKESRQKVPVRADGREAARENHKRYDPRVFQSRWIFAKRAHGLSDEERQRLQSIFADKPKIGVAWLMKEAFASIYDSSDRPEAERRLGVWVANLEAADLPDMTATWRQLSRWQEQILSYFDDRVTNAFSEGITNKIKVIKRVSYGFRSPERYRQKILLACGRRGSMVG